jgi:hypothetical protein
LALTLDTLLREAHITAAARLVIDALAREAEPVRRGTPGPLRMRQTGAGLGRREQARGVGIRGLARDNRRPSVEDGMKERWKAMRLCAILAAFTGCQSTPAVPTDPGTSLPLTYPVLLAGQSDLTVRDDESSLTRTTGASSLNFTERQIIDSAGIIYQIRRATTVGQPKAMWQDMGTSPRHVYLELDRTGLARLDRIQRVVLDQVESPRSVWRGNPNAVERVRGFTSVSALIDGCRTSWEWTREQD